jgi:hypothetical protein
VLALVRQHRAEAHAEGVLSGQTPGAAAAAGFRRLLADPGHRVVLAVLPGPNAPDGGPAAELVVGLAILGLDPLSVVLGVPQVTVDNLVVHRSTAAGAPGPPSWGRRSPTRRTPAPTTSSPPSAGTRPSGNGSSPAWASRR